MDGTVKVLLRAAKMIQEIAGGKCSEVVDVYPNPATSLLNIDFSMEQLP